MHELLCTSLGELARIENGPTVEEEEEEEVKEEEEEEEERSKEFFRTM